MSNVPNYKKGNPRDAGRILDNEVAFGMPDDGTGKRVLQNVKGSWATVDGITAAGVVTFTHRLNVPVLVVAGRAYNHPNVVPALVRITYGDKTGVNAAPAAPAGGLNTSVFFRYGDSVTVDAIELRVATGLALAAATPLNVDIFFIPVVK